MIEKMNEWCNTCDNLDCNADGLFCRIYGISIDAVKDKCSYYEPKFTQNKGENK